MAGQVALVVAAGRGHRVGGPLPKQYIEIAGHAVLWHTLRALSAAESIDTTLVVINPADRELYDTAVADLPEAAANKLMAPVAGGAERQDSVRNGLEHLAAREPCPAHVLIHDGARPFVSPEALGRLADALREVPGAILAQPMADTVKRARSLDGTPVITDTVDRADLWRAQTPQAFRFQDILAAHRAAAGHALTDDAAVAEVAGLAVALIEGDEGNFKITTQADLDRAAELLRMTAPETVNSSVATAGAREVRVGTGFDVHRFGPGDSLMICGVNVPHDQGVVSHSDGDVGLHALVDAILGAIGDGDIGSHFPPSDPTWRDAPSDKFVTHALARVAARGGRLVNADITIIGERPKIGPHREAMRARLAAITGLPLERMSIKATTTESLGFTGRREGIAAQAVATVELPAEAAAELPDVT